MEILFFCPRWGSETVAWPEFARRVREAGYDGVEVALPRGDRAGSEAILDALTLQGLKWYAQNWDEGGPEVSRAEAEFFDNLEWQLAFEVKPIGINCQTGRDYWTAEHNLALIRKASSRAHQAKVPLFHETHRAKFSYAATVAAHYLRQEPELKITADFSHWCNVSESYLEGQEPEVALAIARTGHLHARVGHTEGPQVSDPRAPEWAQALAAHDAWWDRIVAARRADKTKRFTVTPEFGPPPYLPALPYTGQPVGSQWDINLWMMRRLRERWKT